MLVSSCARPTPTDGAPSRIASTSKIADVDVEEEKPAPPPIIGRLGAAREIVPASRTLRAGVEADSRRCSLPRAAAAGKAGLFVTCLDEDAVALFDADALNPHDVELKRWSAPPARRPSRSTTDARISSDGRVPRPGEAKRAAPRRFVVDASSPKLSREPEPILSVRIRIVED